MEHKKLKLNDEEVQKLLDEAFDCSDTVDLGAVCFIIWHTMKKMHDEGMNLGKAETAISLIMTLYENFSAHEGETENLA